MRANGGVGDDGGAVHARGPRPVASVAARSPAIAVIVACLVCQMGLGLGGYIFAVFLKRKFRT